uniref:DNA mismatch repair protein Mlh1-like n=1 Tax=Phallusia mammillata TaxID=59560 RepID=A0A6F9DLK5_9ASCI|nr:DNA mismatch repair protein Mlh1-like [Phallusia mammillata]
MAESKEVVIKRLDETVVNRIAAGEVIQRPANAIKEMIENSLDAGSTSITVAIKSGGLKMIQISDNGHGIRKEDLEIVCERFTTSKLKEFTDLRSITTFGFRGEALASISHVAHLSISSKTQGSQCGYKASYVDGKLKDQPRPTASNDGTQITVEDLFYNVLTRRKAFRSASEEHQRIADVITRYAIHNSGKSFTLRKSDNDTSSGVTVRTQLGASALDNIRALFGSNIANEIIHVEHENETLHLRIKGYISNANCSMKKFNFLLFINNRLVECTSLKRALDAVYQSYLPKGGRPFVYLSLEMPATNLDVNVHPTKHEVHFLHEEAVIEEVQTAIENKLLSCDSSRTFYTQKLLPTASILTKESSEKDAAKQQSERIYDHNLVRTDSKLQKLDAFLVKTPKEKEKPHDSTSLTDKPHVEPQTSASSSNNLTAADLPRKRKIQLTSVLQLQEEVRKRASKDLTDILHDHTFVGCVDPELALIQHKTKLYLANTTKLTREMFYQIVLEDFGNFGMLRLSEPAPIRDLAMLGLEMKESGWTPEDGSKEDLADYIVKFLSEKSEMLKDYFRLEIKDCDVTAIPMLLQNYIPPLEGLPMLVLRLATEVCWDSEKDCFESFAREIARFYAVRKGYTDLEEIIKQRDAQVAMEIGDGGNLDDEGTESRSNPSPWKRTVEHVIYRAMRSHVKPDERKAKDGTFLQLANLPDLYKVFERC